MSDYPPSDAPRADVDAWLAEHAPLPSLWWPAHEAPPTVNTVCRGCEVTRVNILRGPFCRDCARQIEQATGIAVR